MHVPLACKSQYSFLEGASSPGALVRRAHNLGLPALALCDRDGLYGAVRAHVAATQCGLHLVLGSELTCFDGSSLRLLASNRKGYANLCQLISKGRQRSAKGESRVHPAEVAEHSDGLLALWHRSDAAADTVLPVLRDAFGPRLHALILRHRQAGDARAEFALREHAQRFGLHTVAGQDVLYHRHNRRPLQDVLTCIRHGVRLQEAGRLLKPNAEHALHGPQHLADLFRDDPASLAATIRLADECRFSLSDLRYRYPSERLPDGSSSLARLRSLTETGMQTRYPGGIPGATRQQVEKELRLIQELEYDGYFLTMHEIVQFCRRANILCQGRGSAANSAVCYALGITAVDPVRMGLLFERFLSRERNEPPDIDLDIEHDRREEVIQHVYDKYGRRHAAMVANFIRYRTRSAVRDVGKVLGFPETELERLATTLPRHRADSRAVAAAAFDPENPAHVQLLQLVEAIQDAPRHLSIHPGGFLLGHEPVDHLVPIEPASMENRSVIQWDKRDVEDLGLFKVDLLGLGALNVVHRCFDLVEQERGKRWTLASIPPQDEKTFAMIRAADTVGVFQIESRAQMSMLPRLKPRHYYDLVIQISIIRPGPITGGMVHPFLRRRDGEEDISYPHPSLEPVLRRTLGVPLFQEQVMKLAMVAADYTPGEADQLRRDMAAWKLKGRIEQHQERLISRMKAKGIEEEFAIRVFEQIRGFGEYGFPESHAASFALIAYATAWLKCHEPEAFLCAMLNAQPMGFYSPSTLIGDAKRHGVEVRAVDVQTSDWDCTLEKGHNGAPAVRIGLRYIKGFHGEDAERLLQVRSQGAFTDISSLGARCGFGRPVLARLAEAAALQSLEPGSRRDALWKAYGEEHSPLPLLAQEQQVTFGALSPQEEVQLDYTSCRLSTRAHPLSGLRKRLHGQGLPDAATVQGLQHGSQVRYAGMVICRQRPGTAKGVVFMTLEDESGFVNLVIWEKVFEHHRLLAQTQSFLGVSGRIQAESGVVHIVVKSLWEPDCSEKEATKMKSRDFH